MFHQMEWNTKEFLLKKTKIAANYHLFLLPPIQWFNDLNYFNNLSSICTCPCQWWICEKIFMRSWQHTCYFIILYIYFVAYYMLNGNKCTLAIYFVLYYWTQEWIHDFCASIMANLSLDLQQWPTAIPLNDDSPETN